MGSCVQHPMQNWEMTRNKSNIVVYLLFLYLAPILHFQKVIDVQECLLAVCPCAQMDMPQSKKKEKLQEDPIHLFLR